METSTAINIADVIKNYNVLLKFLDPILTCWRAAIYVFSWKNEILSIGMLVMCILIVYNLEIVLFSGCLVGVVCMLLSRQGVLMQRPLVQQPNLKESLRYIHPDNPYLGELLESEKQVEKTIKEYRHMLMQVNKLISQANEAIDLIYRILKWEVPLYSASLLFALCVLCLLSVFVSMRVLLVIVTLYAFCANRGFLEWADLSAKGWWEWLQCNVVSRWFDQQATQHQQQQPPHPLSSHEQDNASINEQNTSEVLQDQAASETEDENSSKLAERKTAPKKKRQENVPSCEKCNVSFAKLLKRKHQCNYCGAVFCGSCTIKVKKSLLGATSPTAYSEMVRVCVDCNSQLEQMQQEFSNYQSSVRNSSPVN